MSGMRRVVITGLGLVTPVGVGVEAAWSNLLAGKSGARRIEEFDASDLSCQIANFVPRGPTSEGKFNPDDWMEHKEQRKVDDSDNESTHDTPRHPAIKPGGPPRPNFPDPPADPPKVCRFPS